MHPRHTFVASGPAEHLERLPLLVLLSIYAVPMGSIVLDLSALSRGDFEEARESLESLWCDEGCGDAVAIPPMT